MSVSIDSPYAVHPLYASMLTTWELTTDLMGGTRSMRAAGKRWLPQEEKEKEDAYQARLERSVLFEAYREAVGTLGGRPYGYPVSLPDEVPLPEPLDRIEKRCDDEGRDLTQFCRHITKMAIDRGLVHVLVDSPSTSAGNLQEQRKLGLKPYFVVIDPMDLLSWRYEVAANGEKKLTQIRIREWYYKDVGDFGVEKEERVRVIYPDRWELYERSSSNKNEWAVVQEGEWSLGEISLVTIYLDEDHGFMTARPPLEGLAWLNLAHWQSFSDHRHNLRFARAGTVTATGITQEELDAGFAWGVNRIISSTNPNAQFGILEHTGNAVKVGEDELRHLEEMMQVLGKAPLMIQSWGNRTAMQAAIDEGKASCDLQAWIRSMEAGIRSCYEYAAKWEGVTLPDDFDVDIWDDFGMVPRSDRDLDMLFRAHEAGVICKRTLGRQIQLRGVLTAEVDLEAEEEAIKQEGPALGLIGREKEEEPEEEEPEEEEPEEEEPEEQEPEEE